MKKKLFVCCIVFVLMACVLCSCTQVAQVNHNLKQEANLFNVCRRLVVYNARSDKLVFEVTGFLSITNNTNDELQVTCEIDEGVYKLHYVYLNEWTMYVVEDLTGAAVSPYHYEINYIPEMIIPFEIVSKK